MITTILAVVALNGSLVPAAKPEFQAQTDYGQALKQAADQNKPMAVLIGKGDAFGKLMTDSALTAEAKKTLAEKYVCVTVDVGTTRGAELAGQFQLTDGLVISSAGGTHQALRQNGPVSASNLATHAVAYAAVSGTPVTTVTAGATPTYVTPAGYSAPVIVGGCANGNCGTPVYRTAPFASTPYYGSSCPNGRCPTPR